MTEEAKEAWRASEPHARREVLSLLESLERRGGFRIEYAFVSEGPRRVTLKVSSQEELARARAAGGGDACMLLLSGQCHEVVLHSLRVFEMLHREPAEGGGDGS